MSQQISQEQESQQTKETLLPNQEVKNLKEQGHQGHHHHGHHHHSHHHKKHHRDHNKLEQNDEYQDQKRQLQLKLIEQAGFKEQNEKLLAAGYVKLRKNLKLLQFHNGNVEAIINFVNKKHEKKCKGKKHDGEEYTEGTKVEHQQSNDWAKKLKKMHKNPPNPEETQKQLKELGFEDANQKLVEMGFLRTFINLKVLQRFNGDVQQSAVFMTETRAKIHKFFDEKLKHIDPELKTLKEQLQAKLKKANEAGFWNTKKIILTLAVYNGDIDRVINALQKKREWKHQMKWASKKQQNEENKQEVQQLDDAKTQQNNSQEKTNLD